jgi:hypothetical protein
MRNSWKSADQLAAVVGITLTVACTRSEERRFSDA